MLLTGLSIVGRAIAGAGPVATARGNLGVGAATIAEDVATGGTRVATDPATLAASANGVAMMRTASAAVGRPTDNDALVKAGGADLAL